VGLGLLLATTLLLLRDPLLSLFGGLDGTTLALARAAFFVLFFEVALRSINVVIIVGGLKAGGDVPFCLGLDFFCAWVVAIPLAALAAFEWQLGFVAVYAFAQSEESSKLLIGLWRLRQRRWMKKLIGEPSTVPSSSRFTAVET
jgi:Na+-driven multidrug efflux pump